MIECTDVKVTGAQLAAEVSNISPHGVWLYVSGDEYFLPYDKFPWFKDTTVGQIHQVELAVLEHLHWPELDVDLAVESIEHPEKFPLVAKHGT